MAVEAGATIIAGKVPGERIATTTRTSNSAAITTTETSVDSVIAAVVIGRTYKVRWVTGTVASVAGDAHIPRIREDSTTGTVLQFRRVTGTTTSNIQLTLEAEYTADATEDKTFVATLIRDSGTGNIISVAASTAPTYLYVEYLRG